VWGGGGWALGLLRVCVVCGGVRFGVGRVVAVLMALLAVCRP